MARKIYKATTDEILHNYFNGPKIDGDNLRYGKETEATAIEEYKAMRNGAGDTYIFAESGLVICRHYPWLCATPDGLIIESNGELTCLEVKCPVSGATGKIKVNYLKNGFLKESSVYYAQVMIQLMACNAKKAHFYMYAKPGEDGERRSKMLTIFRDDQFI